MRAVVLDNEAVAALARVDHPKHRIVAAHLSAVVHRRRRGRDVVAVVPTAVRVEAGWNRADPGAAAINRFPIDDHPLDTATANAAADIAATLHDIGVADAHLGAAVRALPQADVVVLSSDPDDMVRVSQPKPITAVRV